MTTILNVLLYIALVNLVLLVVAGFAYLDYQLFLSVLDEWRRNRERRDAR